MSTTAIPYVRSQSLKRQTLQQMMCSRLDWSDQHFADFQFEAACQFLDTKLKNCAHKEKDLVWQSSMFWGWWRNRWSLRDVSLYVQEQLTAGEYKFQHTDFLLYDERTNASFDSHLDEMILDAKKGGRI